VANLIKDQLGTIPFLYKEDTWYPVNALGEQGRRSIIDFI